MNQTLDISDWDGVGPCSAEFRPGRTRLHGHLRSLGPTFFLGTTLVVAWWCRAVFQLDCCHGGGVGLGDILRNTARHPGALRSGVNTHHAADDACASGAHPEPDARGHLCIGCTFGCSLGRDGRRVLRVCGCACSWPVRRLCAVWGGSCCCCWASTGSAVPGRPNVNPKSVRRDRHNCTCSPADTSWLPSSGVALADLPANDPVHHPGRI